MDNKIFYMVFADGGNVPKKKHENYLLAFEEAQRLAMKEPHKFYVLQAQAWVKRSSIIDSVVLL